MSGGTILRLAGDVRGDDGAVGVFATAFSTSTASVLQSGSISGFEISISATNSVLDLSNEGRISGENEGVYAGAGGTLHNFGSISGTSAIASGGNAEGLKVDNSG